MARGFVSGLVSGAVVSVFGLGVASLLMGPVEMLEGGEKVAAAVPAPEPVPEPAPEPVAEPVAEPEPESEPEPAPEVEATPEPTAAPEPVAQPEATPEPAAAPESVAEPEAVPAPKPDATMIVVPASPPAPEGAPVILPPKDLPAGARSPDQPLVSQGLAPAPQPAPKPAPIATPAPAPQPAPEPAPAPVAESGLVPAPVEPQPQAEPAPAPIATPQPVPAPVATPAPAPQPVPAPVEEAVDEEAKEPPAQPKPIPNVVVEAEPKPEPAPGLARLNAVPVTPKPGTEVPEIVVEEEAPSEEMAEATEPATKPIVNRLPSIGDTPEAAPTGTPALVANGLEYEGADDRPKLAFLLIDAGGDRSALGDISKLPFPISVAVDVSGSDAAQAIDFYIENGAEVLAMLPLPAEATASDVAVAVEAYGGLFAKAAGVLVDEASGFQTARDGAAQLADMLAETGHGLVTFPAGLNTGHKTAIARGIKAGLVFRDLDSEGQDGRVMRRFLDNAAFRAGNQDGVIVVARTRAVSLQALLEWSLGSRAQRVSLAPVSALLLAGEGQ